MESLSDIRGAPIAIGAGAKMVTGAMMLSTVAPDGASAVAVVDGVDNVDEGTHRFRSCPLCSCRAERGRAAHARERVVAGSAWWSG